MTGHPRVDVAPRPRPRYRTRPRCVLRDSPAFRTQRVPVRRVLWPSSLARTQGPAAHGRETARPRQGAPAENSGSTSRPAGARVRVPPATATVAGPTPRFAARDAPHASPPTLTAAPSPSAPTRAPRIASVAVAERPGFCHRTVWVVSQP